jgi:3-hydroxyacyl-CoA dehydrogenase
MNEAVHYSRDGAVAILEIAHAPVNALAHPVRAGLLAGLARANADDAVIAVVLVGRGSGFSAGADIGELKAARIEAPFPNDLHAAIEASGKPVVAALHGVAFGGGLELALACHARVAHPTTRLALPEVKLGLLPGAGGTQRLPRLVGASAALDITLSGDPVDAGTAHAIGLVDALAEDPRAAAIALATGAAQLTPTRDRAVDPGSLPAQGFAARRAAASEGGFAAGLIVDCLEAAATRAFDDGLAVEQDAFRRCLASPEAAARMAAFFARRK